MADIPVIDLSQAPGERAAWDRPTWLIYLWAGCELLLVTNPWQISSRLRIAVLRAFGAEIGEGVIFRPRTRVKFPWKLHSGPRSWVGEGVWFHNQAEVFICNDVVISQETLLTTGSHAHRADMALVARPIFVGPGVWITSRCGVLGGTRMGKNALAKPMPVLSGEIPDNTVVSGSDARVVGSRFNPGAGG